MLIALNVQRKKCIRIKTKKLKTSNSLDKVYTQNYIFLHTYIMILSHHTSSFFGGDIAGASWVVGGNGSSNFGNNNTFRVSKSLSSPLISRIT